MESIPEPKCCCLQHYFSEILICIHVFYKPREETSDFIWPTVTIVLEGRLYKHLVDLKCSIYDRKRVFFHFALWYKVLQFLDWIDNFLTLNEQEELISASALLSSQRHTFTGIADGRVQEGKQFFFFLFYFTGFLVKKKRKQSSQLQFIKKKYFRTLLPLFFNHYLSRKDLQHWWNLLKAEV